MELAPFFCRRLDAATRTTVSKTPEHIAVLREPPSHPIHVLYRDHDLEERVSGVFRKAFRVDLVVHGQAGKEVPLYCGQRPKMKPGEDRTSSEYVIRIEEELQRLDEQGDGMRSFAGILLYTMVLPANITLIDEPEAFLHPPQARFIGQFLGSGKLPGRQLFSATHSGDFLRGLLDSDAKSVRVIRLQRDGNVNKVKELRSDAIKELWNDPLLRYSNILDGLFHEKVVVCESDSDCRFYSAVYDAVLKQPESRRTDVLFTHCGGKDRLPTAVRALSAVSVPVSVIADFDVLNAESPLRKIYEHLTGNWTEIEASWKAIKDSIDNKKPESNCHEVCQKIQEITERLRSQPNEPFPTEAAAEIKKILAKSSSWSNAKEMGEAYAPPGEATTGDAAQDRATRTTTWRRSQQQRGSLDSA
jgi:hypothetical protein